MECQYCCYYLVFLASLLCYGVIASDWPEGYYGLPMASTGCPSGTTFDWKHGWIYQDTENDNQRNDKSTSFHLEGQVDPSSVNRSFCVKKQITNDQSRPLWPAGTYCIYQKKNNCPFGFKSGYITWDDEDTGNKNNKRGTLPKVDLHIHSQTKIYFCCRNDGCKTIPINLPTASPFYLFAHKTLSCQQVKWAVATLEWIQYDTEDDNNQDSVSTSAPYVKTEYPGLKIYYCYYTSCQYTLDASNGRIEFPSHFRNYASGQLCSWRITVKAYQTIKVRFSNFQLSGDVYDLLIFYDGKDDSAPRLTTLHGGNTLREINSRKVQSSSSNLFVVFRASRFNTDSGFQASYTGTPESVPQTTTYSCILVIVISLICGITVIPMAVYLFFRLRNLREKPSGVSVRYGATDSENNPACIPSDGEIEARPPSSNNAYEIQPSRQATDNPLYQSTDEEKHVYASLA